MSRSATASRRRDAVLIGLGGVVIVAADLAYAWRTNRWRASVDRRTAAAFARIAERHADLREHLNRLEAALAAEQVAVAAGVRAGQDVLLELRLDRVRAAHEHDEPAAPGQGTGVRP